MMRIIDQVNAQFGTYYGNSIPQKIFLSEEGDDVLVTLQFDLSVYGGEAEVDLRLYDTSVDELKKSVRNELPNTSIYVKV